MRTKSARSLVLAAALAVAPLLGGCQSATELYADAFLRGNVLSYDEYLSQDRNAVPPVTADSLLEALGPPADVFDRDGIRRRIDYHAFSLTGVLKRAEFHFDKDEQLTKKDLW